VVGAEESLRIKAGAAMMDAAKQTITPNAICASGINSITLSQNVYGKPGALFSDNRLSAAEPKL
jgi:hypothetical protein